MPVSRQNLPPVYGFDRRLRPGDAIDRLTNQFGRWILGTGFLAMHLTVFSVSLLIAYCATLITSPTDVSGVSFFRFWGAVVVVHTILTGGGIVAWKLLGMGDQGARFVVPASTHLQSTLGLPINEYSTQHVIDTRIAPRTAQPASRRLPWASRPVEQNWPQQAGFQKSAPAADAVPDLGEVTWPDSAPLSTTLGLSSQPDADEVVSVDHGPSPSQTWFEGFVGNRAAPEKDMEQRWSWVEAAAASWLSRRDQTTPDTETTSESATETPVVNPPDDSNQPQA
ncbi:MAG TPA: hypothetical protein PK691_00265 [Thermomicrobiales bacterium]|nr:hypothetical protein [Thermomicrobiales bacterium]HRA46494.1 hypothetical protein [Thermomicrobiales bacterium]